MGRGGARHGAGRKPKHQASARVVRHPSSPASLSPAPVVPVGPVEEFGPTEGLEPDALDVWKRQAPHAFAARTLTRASEMSFVRYCRVVALELAEGKSSGRGGLTHRSLLKLVGELEVRFLLTPSGKAMPETVATVGTAVDEDDVFLGGPSRG